MLSHSGVRLGQLLPYGEIVGFIELPPLAQLFDLHNLSLIKPEAENIWVHHTWQQIHKSAGIKRPSWPQYHWPEEIKKSGAVNKNHTFRAIKTFRELSEKLWRDPSSASFQQTLNLMLKEMDYTVLLLLANGHHDDQGAWSDRLKVLFERLDPALRQGNQLANLTSSAVASVPNAEDFHTKLQSWNLPSDLPAVMEGSPESATVSDATLPSAPLSFQEGTHPVKDEQMDMMW